MEIDFENEERNLLMKIRKDYIADNDWKRYNYGQYPMEGQIVFDIENDEIWAETKFKHEYTRSPNMALHYFYCPANAKPEAIVEMLEKMLILFAEYKRAILNDDSDEEFDCYEKINHITEVIDEYEVWDAYDYFQDFPPEVDNETDLDALADELIEEADTNDVVLEYTNVISFLRSLLNQE